MPDLARLLLLCVLVPLAVAAPAQDETLRWRDALELHIEGRAFADAERAAPYDRLPAAAEAEVRPAVWNLSRHSAGMAVRFVTDADRIDVHWTLTNERLAMHHMPSTGVSGVDLYVDTPGGPRWVACAAPAGVETTRTLCRLPERARRTCTLYLPLFNGTRQVRIGVPTGCSLEPAPARDARPIVFYGTSITHGACASRPGMVHVAQVGRRMGRETINLGFSGNGRLDPELVGWLARIDAACYVLDCLPNLDPDGVRERTVPFVEALHAARPDTPIVLCDDRHYADARWNSQRAARNRGNQAALQDALAALRAQGIDVVHLPADRQLGTDGEDTVDGSHPTDLGFARMTPHYVTAIETALADR